MALPLRAPAESGVTRVATETPVALPTAMPKFLLPPVYFRKQDERGIWQVYRVEKDGATVHFARTFASTDVEAFAVSPIDASVAYVTDNQLWLQKYDDPRLLLDSGPVDANNPWINSISTPVWSPDGRLLAYGQGGLNFLDSTTGGVTRRLKNQIDMSTGFPIRREIYEPLAFSADGARLLIHIQGNETGTFGIYQMADDALVRIQRNDGSGVCCRAAWIPDGMGIYITSSPDRVFESGLEYVDAATGAVTSLLPGAAPDGTYNFADGVQVRLDNKLRFLFNNLPEIPVNGRAPLYLVRSEPDGVTGRTRLLPDAFEHVNEVLWDPAGAFVLMLIARSPSEIQGGRLDMVYADSGHILTLLPFAMDLKWGP